MIERTAAALIHGRYLVVPAESDGAPVLAGFHGYGEDAETMMARLCAIPGSESWTKVSIQALNRFYERRTNRVVANWMTRQDREHAIADNRTWVSSCMEEFSAARGIVFAGFSQGVAMAFRAAARSNRVLGVIAAGGDVPPELDAGELARIGRVLLARGGKDEWYSQDKFEADQARLPESTCPLLFEGGHEWSAAVNEAAARLLDSVRMKP